MQVNILAQTSDGTYRQYDCDMMSIWHSSPGQWRVVTDDGSEEIKPFATRTGLVSDDFCADNDNNAVRTGLGDAFRAAMGVDAPRGGTLDGSAHTEILAELLAVGDRAPVISRRSESSAPVPFPNDCGGCSSSMDGYAGDVDEDEKKSYDNNVAQSDGNDADVDEDEDEDQDDDSSASSEYLIIFIYSTRYARL